MTEPQGTTRNSAEGEAKVDVQAGRIEESALYWNSNIYHVAGDASVLGSHEASTSQSADKSHLKSQIAIAGLAVLVAVGAVATTVVLMEPSGGSSARANVGSESPISSTTSSARTIPDTGPRPASANSLPILVEGVGPLMNDAQALIYAVPKALDMTPSQLTAFSANTGTTEALNAWATANNAVQLGNSTVLITIIGNAQDDTARITNINVIDKNCHAPTEATLIDATGGSDTATVPMVVDLDKVEPYAQNDSGGRFFGTQTIPLTYKQSLSLSVDIHTTAECTFKFQFVVATSSGTLTQTVDDNGHPFELTSYRDPKHPFALYQDIYIKGLDDPPGSPWMKMDPQLIASTG